MVVQKCPCITQAGLYDTQLSPQQGELGKSSSIEWLVNRVARYGQLYTKMIFVSSWPYAFPESISGCTPGVADKEVDYIKR